MFHELMLLMKLMECRKIILVANHTNCSSKEKLVEYLVKDPPETTCLVVLNGIEFWDMIPDELRRRFPVILHFRRYDRAHKRYHGEDRINDLDNVVKLYINGNGSPKRGLLMNVSKLTELVDQSQDDLNKSNKRSYVEITTGGAIGYALRKLTGAPVELLGFVHDPKIGHAYHDFDLEHELLDSIGCERKAL